MIRIFALARAFFLTYLRERESFFWLLAFPLLFLALLSLIFGRMGEEGGMSFPIAVVNSDRGLYGPILLGIVSGLGQSPEPGKEPLFRMSEPQPGEDPAAFWARVEKEVHEGRLSAALLIPVDFSARLGQALRGVVYGGETAGPATVQILYRQGEAGSSTAAGILSELVQAFGKEVLVQAGLLAAKPPFEVQMATVGARRTVKYADFIFTGVVLMGLFVAGLFSVPGAVVLARDLGILRQYLVTPLTLSQYFGGFGLGHLVFCLFQALLIWALARFGFGATVSLAQPGALLYLILGLFVSLGFGFLVSALAKTVNGAFALANLVNLPMQFLGGLYFSITGLPFPLRVIMALNPLTHLAEGLRASVGIGTQTFPAWVGPAVLLFWIGLSAGLALSRFQLRVER
ncbi:MAG: ABC transporter permease [Candidatus Bipolaricaulia bacterium]